MTETSTSTRMAAWLEQAWVERYLGLALSDAEREWFEAYVLDKPELLSIIEDDCNLRDAMATPGARERLSERPADGELPEDSLDSARTVSSLGAHRVPGGKRYGGRRRLLPAWIGAAAVLVVGVGLVALGRRVPTAEPSVVGSPTRIVYDTMRGEPMPPRIEHAASASSYALVEIAVPVDVEIARLHIDGAADVDLSTSPDGFVSVLLRRELLENRGVMALTYRTAGRQVTCSINVHEYKEKGEVCTP